MGRISTRARVSAFGRSSERAANEADLFFEELTGRSADRKPVEGWQSQVSHDTSEAELFFEELTGISVDQRSAEYWPSSGYRKWSLDRSYGDESYYIDENFGNHRHPEVIVHSCRPGEGPPAAVPDPQGRGLHPLVYRGTGRRRSRNPTTGDAQFLLNNFLNGLTSGNYRCRNGADMTAIQRIRATLSQDPLEVDCRFGPNTEKVTRMFQRCVFPGQSREWDGKIGPTTWRELERLRTRPVVPVPPSPPVIPPPSKPGVPTEINELLRKIDEALNRIHRSIPSHLRRFIPSTGIVVPSRARFLTAAEQSEARTIYGASLDFSRIVITDGLGFSGRGFTVAVPVGAVWWVALNIGSLAPRATRPASVLLIHELAHAWQSQHHASDKTAFMQNSLVNQAAAEALNAIGQPASAYAYIPGKPFSEYGAEQIAQQIEHSYKGTGSSTPSIVPHVRSVAVHAADADNEASLRVFTGFERLSTTGVIPP